MQHAAGWNNASLFILAPKAGAFYDFPMRIIAVATLRTFWERHPAAEQPLKTWVAVTKGASWADPAAVKRTFNSADILRNGRVVFDIGGNKFRLVARIDYRCALLFVRFIGTHKDYDAVDANEV